MSKGGREVRLAELYMSLGPSRAGILWRGKWAVGREAGGGSVCCAADGAGVGLARILVCNYSSHQNGTTFE